MRIGFGYDVHKLVPERKLILGGVTIPHELGLLGHSDADVLVHALMDAILGAMALGDIGKHFPDTDGTYHNIDSMLLLEKVAAMMKENGYVMGNADCTICAQRPKLAPYIEAMRENIARTLQTNIENISVKATTTEKLGFPGREEGISAYAVCLLKKGE
ncbi:MAG: 2-C-methyl-D-erythritol 2,4-cyclodiphosphate synthase [Clostridia bacterium]|nr:2-C-methyl-D-erythritol 2,4-cyclodiphosphate synthase [Clostridia bacterium]